MVTNGSLSCNKRKLFEDILLKGDGDVRFRVKHLIQVLFCYFSLIYKVNTTTQLSLNPFFTPRILHPFTAVRFNADVLRSFSVCGYAVFQEVAVLIAPLVAIFGLFWDAAIVSGNPLVSPQPVNQVGAEAVNAL